MRAWKGYEQTVGPEHPLTLNTLNHLAVVHLALGDYHEAKEMWAAVLAECEENLGCDHPSTLQTAGRQG